MNWFYRFSTIDWTRMMVVVIAATAFWTAMEAITPPRWHAVGDVVLNAVTVAVAVLIRGNKFGQRDAGQ